MIPKEHLIIKYFDPEEVEVKHDCQAEKTYDFDVSHLKSSRLSLFIEEDMIKCFYIDVTGNLQVVTCNTEDLKLTCFENRNLAIQEESSRIKSGKSKYAARFLSKQEEQEIDKLESRIKSFKKELEVLKP